ncbi:phosphoserine phosphatase SerB [Lichenifustis flavocetrariae]|uniref:Phosphoserine phosphatase n=1 Tax=Lichenifustis flavocetrariae TaxID=2949735 RepID=A0AA41Z0E8_9HYPH|nr:phosphoserine phosphatase SerB [Lichenifustis flavocetrariae]MCW6510560.1 phosphoserine phosphatase SerB [Lichenifustis flavocetrariae]
MTSDFVPCVATFIAPDANTELLPTLRAAQSLLPKAGAPTWLDPERAADIFFEADLNDLASLRDTLMSRRSRDAGIDIVVQPSGGRRKRLFLADMDSTMIGQECIDELADFAGLKPRVSAITERAMRGELAFEPALRERVSLLKGLPLGVVDEVIGTRITMTPGGTALVRTMQAHGAYCCLVSGGFTLFTSPIAARIGFDEHRGNILLSENGQLSGEVAEPILGRAAKLQTLVELRDRFGLAPHETLAVGDGANDLAMIGEAGLGVAFRAKPAVAAAAAAQIDHNDLTALLFAQGYPRSSFAPEGQTAA